MSRNRLLASLLRNAAYTHKPVLLLAVISLVIPNALTSLSVPEVTPRKMISAASALIFIVRSKARVCDDALLRTASASNSAANYAATYVTRKRLLHVAVVFMTIFCH